MLSVEQLRDDIDAAGGNYMEFAAAPHLGGTWRDKLLPGEYGVFVRSDALDEPDLYRTILVHEWGHCATGCLHKTGSPYETVERMEARAWRASIRRYLPFEELDYYVSVCGMAHEDIAQQMGCTEDFVARAIEYYTGVCGYRFRRRYWG